MIPISILSTEHRKDLKTLVLAQVLRFCSIFRVSTIAFYRDDFSRKDDEALCEKVSRYLLTPPYLRKYLIPLDPDLRYVGLVPPLALPLHSVTRHNTIGSIRWGVVVSANDGGAKVFVGLKKPCLIEGSRKRVGEVVLLELLRDEGDRYICKELDPKTVPIYLGPEILIQRDLYTAISSLCRNSLLVEFTKLGDNASKLVELVRSLDIDCICCVFGSPYLDASEILKRRASMDIPTLSRIIGAKHIAIDAVVEQGVRSIRSVEALGIGLAVLNLALLLASRCS